MSKSRIVRILVLFSVCLALVACGGGGGGDGGDATSSTANLALSTSTVEFTTFPSAPLPSPQSVDISWTNPSVAGIVAGYPPEVTPPSWLDINFYGSSSPMNLTFTLNTTNLAVGTYTTTVRVITGDINSNILGVKDIDVTLTMTNMLAISSSENLFFNMVDGAPTPTTQAVNLIGSGINWSASVNVPWVELSQQTGTAPSALTLGIDPTGLVVGTYNANVSFEDDITGDIALLNVTLTIIPNILGISSSTDMTFNTVFGGGTPSTQPVKLTGNGIEWTAYSADSWIQLSQQTGTTPSDLTIGIDPTGLSPGTYYSTVDFEDVATMDTVSLDVTFTIEPNHLALTSNADMIFDIVKGGALPSTQAVDLIGDGVEWTATPSASWIALSQLTGTAPNSLTIGLDPTGLVLGDYTATVDFADDNSNEFVTVNVQLSVEGHNLFTHDNGIALVSMPSLSQLTYTADVLENSGTSTPWTATSDQIWLSATSAGNTGDPLVLTADPTGLSVDTIHYASVTIDSSDPTIEAPETIRVGLWVSSADSNPTDTLNLTYTELATDHIRPLVYMHDGGSNIDVYNVHTSAFVRTIPNVGAQLGDMEISSDGSYLYVADLTNYDIVPVNLDTDAVDSPIDLAGAGSLWLAYGRTQGKSLLFSSTGLILDPDTGSAFATTFLAGYNSGSMPAISQNGEKVCGVRLGVSPYTIECYDIDYSAKNGGALTLTSLGTTRPGSNAKDLALTQDGSRVYVASGAPYNFVGIDTDTMVQDQTLPANAYPNCVEIGSNNLLYGGAFSWYGPLDLWVYSFTGIEQSSYYISGYADEIRDRQLVLSGDGLRIILSATDPKVVMLDSP